jgi:hypothetical protein
MIKRNKCKRNANKFEFLMLWTMFPTRQRSVSIKEKRKFLIVLILFYVSDFNKCTEQKAAVG